MARGLEPAAIKFLQFSATEIIEPKKGSDLQYIGLQSQEIAIAFLVL